MKNGKNYTIKFSKQAEKDKLKLKSSNLDKNCRNILDLIQFNPFCYPPSFEKLNGDLEVLYSKHINRQRALFMDLMKKKIHIIRMWTHYDKL